MRTVLWCILVGSVAGVHATENCGAHCMGDMDCGNMPGPCAWCHEGACRPPSAPEPTKASALAIKSGGCYAQYCSSDGDCVQTGGCPICSPPIHPLDVGICLPPSAKDTANTTALPPTLGKDAYATDKHDSGKQASPVKLSDAKAD